MAELTLVNKKLSSIAVDAIILGCAQGADGPQIISDCVEPVDPTIASQVAELAEPLGITGAPDEVHVFPAPAGYQAKVFVLSGLGKPKADARFEPETLRRAAGAAVRRLQGTATVALALPADDEPSLKAVAEGGLLGAYAYNDYRTGPAVKAPVAKIQVVSPLQRSERAKATFSRAEVIANAVARARDLTDTPPNVLFPGSFADIAVSAAKGLAHVKTTVLDEKQLKSGGYVGLTAVGQGSARGPRLVKVEYRPSQPVGSVGLVGKGITFDSGGISIKPSAAMHEMTMDMSGAAIVLETVVAAAQLQLPVAVIGYLCLAENLPGGGAARPGDIIKFRNGKTVQIDNTDAEGRLVLADGIIDAVKAGVDVVVDIATLTGAQIMALGYRTSAVMGTPSVRDGLVSAADECGEQFWAMPIPEEMTTDLKSNLADISNIGTGQGAKMLFAAAFLREFVGETPFGHIDIAGPAFNSGAPWGYTPKGGTGVGVRSLVTFLEKFAQHPAQFKTGPTT